MSKFRAREPEVIDAYQFAGGKKDGSAMAKLISQCGADAAWREQDISFPERIKIVTDTVSENMYIGDWLVIMENGTTTHMTDADFKVKYTKVKFRPSVLIWKDIPGFPNWQVSDNGRVRNTGYAGYKHRTRNGDFILRRNGKTERWSESQIGNEEQIKEFFHG